MCMTPFIKTYAKCFILMGSKLSTAYSLLRDFPGGSVVKNPPANIRDTRDAGSIPGLGRSLGEGNNKLLQ